MSEKYVSFARIILSLIMTLLYAYLNITGRRIPGDIRIVVNAIFLYYFGDSLIRHRRNGANK